MSVFHGVIFSESLKSDTGLTVILPHDSRQHRGILPPETKRTVSDNPRVLYLLHGLGDNHMAWLTHTTVSRMAETHDIAVVMPEVHRSFYQDMVYGSSYGTYVSEELPQLMRTMFHVSARAEDTFVAGLSMGGYGALYCTMKHPEQYSAAGIFSAGWDLESMDQMSTDPKLFGNRKDLENSREMYGAFGGAKPPKEVTIPWMMDQLKTSKVRYYIACGTEDPLYQKNLDLYHRMEKKEWNVAFESYAGEHSWDVWEKAVAHFIQEEMER